jgi:hypothetical protein
VACDLCGKRGTPLADLLDIYVTDEVKQICPACEDVVNKHLRKVRGVTHNILVGLMKRFLSERASQGKETGGSHG